MSPTIAVLIPCYNHARFVTRAVESAFEQTYPVKEVIIVNDGSTDNSAEVLDGLAAKYPDRVKVFHQKNAGPAWTRQQAAEHATADFVFPIDADDYLHPDAVRVTLDYQQKNPRFVVVYGNHFRVDENGVILEEHDYSKLRNDPLEGNILNTMTFQSVVTSTALVRRDKLMEVGGYYSEDTGHAGRGHEDYFLYMKLLLAGYEFGYVPFPLFYYRDLPGSVSDRSGSFHQNRVAVLKHLYRINVDRMVDAMDYAMWKRVDQLESAWKANAEAGQWARALQTENEALKEQIEIARVHIEKVERLLRDSEAARLRLESSPDSSNSEQQK